MTSLRLLSDMAILCETAESRMIGVTWRLCLCITEELCLRQYFAESSFKQSFTELPQRQPAFSHSLSETEKEKNILILHHVEQTVQRWRIRLN